MQSIQRNNGIDFTKGFLVIIMVAYHTLNYFVEGYNRIVYGYVYYVGQSFVFYSGFLCGTIYLDKFKKDKRYVQNRLSIRSLKLISIFIILNIIINLLIKEKFGQKIGIKLFFENIYSIMSMGIMEPYVNFKILLPIAYTLLICCFLINFYKMRYISYALLICFFFIISFYSIKLPFNLYHVLMGIGGFCSGLICMNAESLLGSKLVRYSGIFLLSIFFIILIPAGINVRDSFIFLYLYVNLIIANLYMLGSFLNPSKIITKYIIIFGQYSLYLYLVQIFLLQVFARITNIWSASLTKEHVFIFVAVNILLVICCYVTDYLRNNIILFNKVYRFVFS